MDSLLVDGEDGRHELLQWDGGREQGSVVQGRDWLEPEAKCLKGHRRHLCL